MPPRKRSRVEQPFDATIFVSAKAAIRYNRYNQNRVAISERGIDVPGPINDEIGKRNWNKLCSQPDPAIVPLVMEFYANAREPGVTDTVFVRGKQVCFSRTAINQFYGLSDISDDTDSFYDFLHHHVDWADVINEVCREETTWKYCANSSDVSHFPTKQLAAFPRAWFYFISAKLMPASHLSSVHRNRAALIFAIVNDIPIDVGQVIHESISYCIKDESLAFVCPSLITSLCKAAGVVWRIDEPLLPVKGIFDSKAFHSMKDCTSGFGTEEDYALPPAPPKRLSVGQKLDKLERRMEALSVYQRQANEVLHQSLTLIAQQREGQPVPLPPLPRFPDRDDDDGAGPSDS